MADEKIKKSKTKLKKPTPLGFLTSGLKKGLKRVVADIKPLPGRTWTGKRKVSKDPKRPVIARREDSIQLPSGKIITPKGGVKNYKLKPGEKKVSRVKGNVIPGKQRKRPSVGRLQKSASVKKVADIDKVVTKRNLRRFGTRAAAIAAGAYTIKKIKDVLTGPKVAVADKPSSGGSYKVIEGDTLSQIAKRKGTTLKALLAANNIPLKDANKLSIGQSLKIPAKVKDRKSVYQDMKKSEMEKIAMKKKRGGKVGKKKQGYKARKDESIAMRVKKKRTKKQLKASRNESYGKWGKGKGRGKINRSSGSSFVAKLYD